MVKSRGLIPFRDNFVVPSASQLSHYQKKILDLCGLQTELVGKPGKQSRAAELWINSKRSETGCEYIGVSVSMDGKKISVTESGVEDMAGLGNTQTREEDLMSFDKDLARLVQLANLNDRKSFFSLLDSLTALCQQLVSRLASIEQLLSKNMKLLERNPLLSKYIFVLKSQLSTGQKLVMNMRELQRYIVDKIAIMRNCKNLLPVNEAVNLEKQDNFHSLFDIPVDEERENSKKIMRGSKKSVLLVSWPVLLQQVSRNCELLPRSSQNFGELIEFCYLASGQVFSSCGLGKSHPLKDMKQIYTQAHSKQSSIETPSMTDPVAVSTFCSTIAPVVFGKNCVIHEAGIFIRNGICSDPDLLVYENSGPRELQYTVRVIKCDSNVFSLSSESVATCVIDSYLGKSAKGTILLSYNTDISVAFLVPADKHLAEEMLALGDSYIKKDKCIVKRSSEMLKKIKEIESQLHSSQDNITILGCFPVVSNVPKSSPSGETHELRSETRLVQTLTSTFKDIHSFMTNKAKELIAVNVSDLSGNPSKTPHTTLAATYLSSSSLKVVGNQCISEVCDMLEQNKAEVLNIGVDGESLQMAKVLPNGSSGTFLSLVKHIYDKLKEIKKDKLFQLASSNANIDISLVSGKDDDEEDDLNIEFIDGSEDIIMENIVESVALIENESTQISNFTSEDIEEILSDWTEEGNDERKKACKALKLAQLRLMCLKYVVPRAKKIWLLSALGRENITIKMSDGLLTYTPNSIFQKTRSGFYRTVSFDYAHIINLFREHAAKGKLGQLGLDSQNLLSLSRKPKFEYLQRIIALKGKKLMFFSHESNSCCFAVFE